MRMKRDLHLKKVYVAITLTALTMIPTAFAIGAFLDNNKKSNSKVIKATLITHQQTEILSEGVCD